jgi:hypothetical protein
MFDIKRKGKLLLRENWYIKLELFYLYTFKMIKAEITYVSALLNLIFWCTQKMNEFIKVVLNGSDGLLGTLSPQTFLSQTNTSSS